MAFESDSLPMPATVTTQPAPVQTDMRTDCKAWYLMRGLHTCQLIASMFGAFSLTDFIAWHPAVKADCSGLQKNTWYCVAVPGTPTTRTTTVQVPMPTGQPERPVQNGMVSGCKRLYFVNSGDGCWAIANSAGIALSDFYAWNPAVNKAGECAGLWLNVWVCTGLK